MDPQDLGYLEDEWSAEVDLERQERRMLKEQTKEVGYMTMPTNAKDKRPSLDEFKAVWPGCFAPAYQYVEAAGRRDLPAMRNALKRLKSAVMYAAEGRDSLPDGYLTIASLGIIDIVQRDGIRR